MSLPWNTAIITGANSGIGLYLARQLLRGGASLLLLDLSFSANTRAELETTSTQQQLVFAEADVRDASALADAVADAMPSLAGPVLAVNCAGIQIAKPFLEFSAEEFSRVVDINLKGSSNFAAAVLPHMGAGSRLALVASLAGLVPTYAYSAYNATKYGVVGLAGALRLECINRQIDVSVVCPPEVNTPMVVDERKTIGPITKELKAAAGTLELDEAGDAIFNGLIAGKTTIIPGFRARVIWRLSRWMPGVMNWFSTRIVRKHA